MLVYHEGSINVSSDDDPNPSHVCWMEISIVIQIISRLQLVGGIPTPLKNDGVTGPVHGDSTP